MAIDTTELNDTTIVINTLGRINKQITWNNLPPEIRERTFLSVQKHEFYDYPPGYNIIQLPEHIKNLPDTRQWLIENVQTRFLLIMDDDLTFFTRRDHDHKHLHKMTPEEHTEMFLVMRRLGTDYPMVGISAREGNNRQEDDLALCTRSMRIFLLDLGVLQSNGFRFDRTKTKEDMDMTLQLLRSGYRNAVLYRYANDHVSSNAPGGCKLYRTLELMKEDAHRLHALHPAYVKVVEKQTKTSWEGQKRTDVVVQWKKAFMDSLVERY